MPSPPQQGALYPFDEECFICLQPFRFGEVVSFPCSGNHHMHGDCYIFGWEVQLSEKGLDQSHCPLCRQQIGFGRSHCFIHKESGLIPAVTIPSNPPPPPAVPRHVFPPPAVPPPAVPPPPPPRLPRRALGIPRPPASPTPANVENHIRRSRASWRQYVAEQHYRRVWFVTMAFAPDPGYQALSKGLDIIQQPSEAEAGHQESLEKRIAEEWMPSSRNMTYMLAQFKQKVSMLDNSGKPVLASTDSSNPWCALLEEVVSKAYGTLGKPEICPASTDAHYFQLQGLPAIGFSPMANTHILLHDHNEVVTVGRFQNGGAFNVIPDSAEQRVEEVEHVVREEKLREAYELIEIYCELIAARLPMFESQKNCLIDLEEAVSSVIFASPRCADVPELMDIHKHFTAKYGKEFVSAAVELRPDSGVSRMVIEKLSTKSPDVKWDPEAFEEKPAEDLLNGPNTFGMASATPSPTHDVRGRTNVQVPPNSSMANKAHVEAPPGPLPPDKPPNAEVPRRNYEFQDGPVNSNEQIARSSPRLEDSASTNVSANKATTSTTFHPETISSGSDRMEMHGDDNSSGRQNWNMQFKGTASAAQAAAE